jgi:hypothetical protein
MRQLIHTAANAHAAVWKWERETSKVSFQPLAFPMGRGGQEPWIPAPWKGIEGKRKKKKKKKKKKKRNTKKRNTRNPQSHEKEPSSRVTKVPTGRTCTLYLRAPHEPSHGVKTKKRRSYPCT